MSRLSDAESPADNSRRLGAPGLRGAVGLFIVWAVVGALAGCKEGEQVSNGACGDGLCSHGDTCYTCPEDCGACVGPVCGDGECAAPESCATCFADCGVCPSCGDGACALDEGCASCPEDCGLCADVCGDGICGRSELCLLCPTDCGLCQPVCGDGVCGLGEGCETCLPDCGACQEVCGDGYCTASESCGDCPGDCGACVQCGNGQCESGETCETCSVDCGACQAVCSDTVCELGETCQSCPTDCGVCPPVCGDGFCDGGETIQSCEQDCYNWPSDWATKEEQILTAINDFRSQTRTCRGVAQPAAPPLTMDPQIRLAARLHSQEMADNDYFSHTGLDGSSSSDRIFAAGYAGSCPCGENIAAGNASATDTMDQWITSTTGHCENMMSPDFTKIGIGYAYNSNSTYGHYWTQNFAD